MKNSTKLNLLAISLLASSFAWAAGTDFPDGQTTIITHTLCGAFQDTETARVGLSRDVAGSYECSTTNAAIATGSYKGRGNTYNVHSGGSTVAEKGNGSKFANRAAVIAVTNADVTTLLAIADSSSSN